MAFKEKFEEKKQKAKEFYEKHKLEAGLFAGVALTFLGVFVRNKLQDEETVEEIHYKPGAAWAIGHDNEDDCNFMQIKRPGQYIKTSHGREMELDKDVTLGFVIDKQCYNELMEELSGLSFDSEEEDL